ncbi:MAG: hypothetical protein HLX50_14615 [Alteromonadaceae bacterium]|nr:hypothetical protein [Alteromonadaceae bacterium]
MRFSDASIQQMLAGYEPKRLLVFGELQFPSGWVRAHTGIGDRTYQGQVYKGVGELAKIGSFKESGGRSSRGFDVSLVVHDVTLFADTVQEDPTNGTARLHLVGLDENRRVTEGALLFDGDIGAVSVKKGKPFVITLKLTDWYERWSSPVQNARMTDEAQQAKHPGDKFFDQVEKLAKGIESDAPGQYVGSPGGGGGSTRQRRTLQQR